MILIIDNFDSFVHNLARYVRELDFETKVYRNNAISLENIDKLKPSHIFLSPGPCTPNEAGICLDLIQHFGNTIPILGVCLGHQAIGQAYGGNIIRANQPMHGKACMITHDEKHLFKGLRTPLKVARYHSLVVERDTLPKELIITATSADGDIMALQHHAHPVFGVQFHPESILTECGYDLLRTFLTLP